MDHASFQVVGGHPNLPLDCDALLMEVGLTTVDELQQVRLAVELGEVQLLEPGWTITMVFAMV
jgi:hypothetical protein